MKAIGIDYTPAYAQHAGIGRLVRNQISALSKIDTDNAYKLFVSGRHLAKDLNPGMRIYRSQLSDVWLSRFWNRLHIPIPIEFWLGSIDLFHATDFVLPPLLPKTKSILTIHDLSFIRSPGAAPERLVRYLNKVVPDSLARSNHIIADSEATKTDLIEIYSVVPERITVVLSGVEDLFFDAPALTRSIKEKYSLPMQHPYLLSVGTVQPRKNYTRVIEALKYIRDKGFDIHYVISGGKGWLDNPIYRRVHELYLQDYVHFVGFVDEADLPMLYRGASVVLYPSIYEGFGLPILEAMATRTPVITSDISSMPEVAGDAAILVNPYDTESIYHAIERVLTDDTLRKQLIKDGEARARLFTWEKSAHHLKQVYDKILNDEI